MIDVRRFTGQVFAVYDMYTLVSITKSDVYYYVGWYDLQRV